MKQRNEHLARVKSGGKRRAKPVAPKDKSLRYFGDPESMVVAANCVKKRPTSLGELLWAKLEAK